MGFPFPIAMRSTDRIKKINIVVTKNAFPSRKSIKITFKLTNKTNNYNKTQKDIFNNLIYVLLVRFNQRTNGH